MTEKFEEAVRLYNMKRWDQALQTFHGVDTSSFTPAEKMELAYYLGLCYTKLERYSDAVLYFEQVVTSEATIAYMPVPAHARVHLYDYQTPAYGGI